MYNVCFSIVTSCGYVNNGLSQKQRQGQFSNDDHFDFKGGKGSSQSPKKKKENIALNILQSLSEVLRAED